MLSGIVDLLIGIFPRALNTPYGEHVKRTTRNLARFMSSYILIVPTREISLIYQSSSSATDGRRDGRTHARARLGSQNRTKSDTMIN